MLWRMFRTKRARVGLVVCDDEEVVLREGWEGHCVYGGELSSDPTTDLPSCK